MTPDDRSKWVPAAVVGLVAWMIFTLLVIDPLMRRIVHALTGVRLERSLVGSTNSKMFTWNATEPGHGWLEFAYWIGFWTVALGLPLLVGGVAMYLQWLHDPNGGARLPGT